MRVLKIHWEKTTYLVRYRRESDSSQSLGRSKPVICTLTEHTQTRSDSVHISLSVETHFPGSFVPDEGTR